jgi:hypothetical protein
MSVALSCFHEQFRHSRSFISGMANDAGAADAAVAKRARLRYIGVNFMMGMMCAVD